LCHPGPPNIFWCDILICDAFHQTKFWSWYWTAWGRRGDFVANQYLSQKNVSTAVESLATHTSLSPIRRGFVPVFVNCKKECTRLAAASDKVYQLLAHRRWFSAGTPASSTTKTGRHIAESGVLALRRKLSVEGKSIEKLLRNTLLYWNHVTDNKVNIHEVFYLE
jgi:hypothetical protein